MTVLLANIEAPLIQAAQLVFALSLLILLHEMGHFLPAKWFKCRVEKFMLFFDAGFALFKKKIGETVYGLGWLPLGGYVKIAGMIDESMDKDAMKQPPQPDEFRSKPAWQRLIIMIGGVTMNFLLAFFLFAVILQVWGETYLPPQNAIYGLTVDTLGRKVGLQDGDIIMSLDGKPVKDEDKVVLSIYTHDVKDMEVFRNGQTIHLPIPGTFIGELAHNHLDGFANVAWPTIVDSVSPTAHIVEGTLLKGDKVISFNGIPTPSFESLTLTRVKHKNETVDLGLIRGVDTLHIKAHLDSTGTVGFLPQRPDKFLTYVTKKYDFFSSFPAGVRKSIEVMNDYLAQLKLLFTNKHVKSQDTVGSVITIARAFQPHWDWESLWKLTAFLSVILGFMNILPIPALDGGHILFLLVEMISGRKPSDKFMEYAQIFGMILLVGLMAYALGLDVFRAFKH